MRRYRTMLIHTVPLFAALMAAPAVAADVKAGVDAWQRGEYGVAITNWRPLAIAGDADAQFNLAQAYKLGRGVPTDLKQAEVWFRKAADKGHFQAQDNLGLILFSDNRREEAMPFIRQSASRGEPRAQYILGTAHFNGDLAPLDWPRAYALTKKASDSGLAMASARLSQLDQLIPLDQRQKGLAMLPQMDQQEQQTRLAAAHSNVSAPPAARAAETGPQNNSPASGVSFTPPPTQVASVTPGTTRPNAIPTPIQKTEVPPSTAHGTSFPAPPVAAPATGARPAAPPPAKAVQTAQTGSPATPAATKPAVRTTAPAQTGVNSGGDWRVQFGAFSVEANAQRLWSQLKQQQAGLTERQPLFIKSGTLTRLQVGGFATRSGAEQFCRAFTARKQACLPIRK